jgi:hypothetical protein
MYESITVSPPNSLILVMDHASGELPTDIAGKLIAATASCVAVGTLSAADGETTITLTDEFDEARKEFELVFDDAVLTPQREISVCNVRNEKLLTVQAPSLITRVQIYANDDREPDRIVICIGGT